MEFFIIIFITLLISFYITVELLFLITNKSIRNIGRAYKLLKNIKNLKFAGKCYYYNFYFTDNKDFWILQYSKESNIFKLYKWEENSNDGKNFYFQLGQLITGLLFFLVTIKIKASIKEISGYSVINYDIRKEDEIIKIYTNFKKISKRRNIVAELTQ